MENNNLPLISVLVNCYNGEKFLNECLDSILSQSYQNWEIIFIDNCSADSSANIAKTYPNINYFKTDKNIPLGAARNYGLTHCSGKYVAFLDTDDIWLSDALNILLKAIESDNYILAYGGQIEINATGNTIGEYIPQNKEGILLESLLMQFDIPIVASMLNLEFLKTSGLSFDNNIYASEEYCLFMQLAASFKIISVNKKIVKYRIHSNSLTNSTMKLWAKERRYTLAKIEQKYPEYRKRYLKGLNEAYARAAYYEVQFLISGGNKREARLIMSKYMFLDYKYFIVYVFTVLPVFLWDLFQNMKYKRKNKI